MKLLLTSAGITNDSLAAALEGLAGKPFAELKIGFVPTAAFSEPGDKGWLIADLHRLKERGAEVDIIDIAQLPVDEILARLQPVDVLFVGGGNTYYLSYWMEKSGLFAALPKLLETKVYAGISAGSMVMGKTIRVSSQALNSDRIYDDEYHEFGPLGRSAEITYNAVDFSVRPHLGSRYFPEVTEKKVQQVANRLDVCIYAIDDSTAIQVVDGVIEVISEGNWHLIEPGKES